MLDTETKRRIDTARDILVGVVPDPKSQVEQITIALIYKFMDDMDNQSVEMGGERSFFVNEFEKYAWHKLFAPNLEGHEFVFLYSDALEQLKNNPSAPKLFNDIFKNAFLPFRNPPTLRQFLKVINQFNYDHSERLGDAFEYLLSVLGSQGDAGQFRTPRHIIDFIVEVVNPQKGEKILDPACGTAGFLISAYKHIRLHNPRMTPEERMDLAKQIVGYDISPDMVRLSLVNLYLHGFVTPQIHDYDTLTSDERWGHTYDVILANPPFMSPKGGIQPHTKFEIQANRSEVLFVDYIAEHLHPVRGRAGIIVPEGIIFQSGKAYKALRKMLIDRYLYAVVSLPAGVFNPYSGVKTSILLLDKAIAGQTDNILFVKIEKDGFELGAQRRPAEQNDLPHAVQVIQAYRNQIKTGENDPLLIDNPNFLIVKKADLAANDYNLSADRYRKNIDEIRSNQYPWVKLGEVCTMQSGSREKGGAIGEGIPSIGGEQIAENGTIRIDKMKYVSREHYDSMKTGKLQNLDVLMVKDGATTGKMGYYTNQFEHAAINEHVYLFRANQNKVLPLILFQILKSDSFQNQLKPYIKGIIGGVSSEIKEIEIPLPPLSVQEAIVAKIEKWQKVIDGARELITETEGKIQAEIAALMGYPAKED